VNMSAETSLSRMPLRMFKGCARRRDDESATIY
jgi:hypothetical protein